MIGTKHKAVALLLYPKAAPLNSSLSLFFLSAMPSQWVLRIFEGSVEGVDYVRRKRRTASVKK